jgi:hypothetical protein
MAKKKAIPFEGKETEAEEALEHKILKRKSKRGKRRISQRR